MIARSLVLVTFIALTQTSTMASQVLWGSARLATNYISKGAPETLDGGFTFQLGSFSEDFIPSQENTSEWLDHWTPVQSTPYNAHTRFFTGSFVFTPGDGPLQPGKQGYIFGFNRWASSEGGHQAEWILATDPTWRWPAGGAIAPPVQWSMSNAAEVVLGSIGNDQDPFHMMTAAVSAPVDSLSGDLWSKRYLGQEPDPIANLDSDHDGLSDSLEFFLNTDPNTPDQGRFVATNLVEVDGRFHLELAFFKLGQIAGTSLGTEVSSDLETWDSAENLVEVVEDSVLVYRVRTVDALQGAPTRFFRLKAYVTP